MEDGDPWCAARLSGAAEAMDEAYDKKMWEPAERRFHDHYFDKLRAALEESDFANAYTEGRQITGSEVTSLAREVSSGFEQKRRHLRLVGRRAEAN